MQALKYEAVVGNTWKYIRQVCGRGRILCKSRRAQDEFCSQRIKIVKRKRCENEKRPQDKGDVKTEGVKGNIEIILNFDRKRSQISK